MRTKMRALLIGVSLVGISSCLSFPPGDICGYAGFCSDGGATDGPSDGSMDGPIACPSGKEPKDDPSCVADSLGIFVSAAGNDSAAGTKAAPVKTLTQAFKLAKSGSKPRVFVCEGNYLESADLTDATSVFGGFKCADWSYSGIKPKFAATKPDWVLHIDGVNGAIQIDDVELDGADVPAAMKGSSSIALFANASMNVTLVRLMLTGGVPQAGSDGTRQDFSFPDPMTKLIGNDAMGSNGGAANQFTMCPGGGTTTGGKGGDNGFAGSPGQPNYGAGQGGASSNCGVDGTGKNGNPPSMSAKDGIGAAGLGSLSSSGWAPGLGVKGDDGQPGQGGGGGYGSGGGGGGGGGAGGCGGVGGGGGAGGGASVALASLNSNIKVLSSTLIARSAGKGGNGAMGQTGQSPGGLGGNRTAAGCLGGNGGAGGSGGGGGGGAGGVSVGVLYKGPHPMSDSATLAGTMVGAKGGKGTGTAGNDGADGVAQAELMAP